VVALPRKKPPQLRDEPGREEDLASAVTLRHLEDDATPVNSTPIFTPSWTLIFTPLSPGFRFLG
jgi:hypothetical protein